MKKSTKHGRKLARKVFADPLSVYKVMGRIQHFTQSELMALSVPPHLAFESLRTGRGNAMGEVVKRMKAGETLGVEDFQG